MNLQPAIVTRLLAAFAILPGPLRGALLMTAAAASFAVMTVLVRHLAGTMHPFEIAFFRNLFGLFFMLPWLARNGFVGLRTQRFAMHGLRSLVGLAAMLSWFTAISLMPVADATALNFTAPLFTTMGAALVLGEEVGVRRWSAVIAGFVGAMIIVRPGFVEVGTGPILAIAAAGFMSMAALTIKALSRTENASAMVLYMGLLMTPASLIAAWPVWTWPGPADWVWFVGMGLFATLGQLAMIRAFAAADASAVLPFDFSRLIFTALLGFLIFAEVPDLYTWIGGGVIFAATLYTAHRESRLAKA